MTTPLASSWRRTMLNRLKTKAGQAIAPVAPAGVTPTQQADALLKDAGLKAPEVDQFNPAKSMTQDQPVNPAAATNTPAMRKKAWYAGQSALLTGANPNSLIRRQVTRGY
jgi:hypothetical protein